MRRSTLAPLVVLLATSCAHRGNPALSEPSKKMAAEAASVRSIQVEEEFLDARAVYQSLPVGTHERATLRAKLFDYLLAPLLSLEPERLRAQAITLGSNDDFDRVLESYKDALELVAPKELWMPDGPALSARERAQLIGAGRLVLTLFGPRGMEADVALALLSLSTLDPKNPEWSARLAQLLPWIETGAQLAITGAGPRPALTVAEALERVAGHWPSPEVVGRLTTVYVKRQERFATAMRRPIGTGASRSAFSELLLEGEAIQATAFSLAALYLRCGQIEPADRALEAIAGKPGDDPELRELLDAAAKPRAEADDLLALARRFLPKHERVGGTSTDRYDLAAAMGVLEASTERHPGDVETLQLASRLAGLSFAPFLALRHIEEAHAAAEKSRAAPDLMASIASERLELSFTKLKARLDAERLEPSAREAEVLRSLSADARKRFGEASVNLSGSRIDVALAEHYIDAGLPERAEPLLLRAQQEETESGKEAEIALRLGELAFKQGHADRAAAVLGKELERQRADAPVPERVGYVQNISKLARSLGDALEATGKRSDARAARLLAQRGYERLMIQFLRDKAMDQAAEALVELGRLYYLTGRQADGIQKLNEAIDQNEGRDQSYSTALAFLVQRGELEAALDVYRRAMSKPNRVVSEYLKVYFTLWVLDLSRRAGRELDQSADAYLRAIVTRPVSLRPTRAAAWYVELAKYALGRSAYQELLAKADTPGKRAELHFYEAMRRLAEGQSDDAHALWTKVIETKMYSFIEFEMAARYLRLGAPTQAAPEATAGAEAI